MTALGDQHTHTCLIREETVDLGGCGEADGSWLGHGGLQAPKGHLERMAGRQPMCGQWVGQVKLWRELRGSSQGPGASFTFI